MRFEMFEVQSSVFADLLLFGEFKQGIILLTSEFIGNSVLFNVLFYLLHLPFLWCFKCTIKTENLQMCKKEKYEKHRNVLVFFFAFAMLVVLNSQKLSLTVRSIGLPLFVGSPPLWPQT